MKHTVIYTTMTLMHFRMKKRNRYATGGGKNDEIIKKKVEVVKKC